MPKKKNSTNYNRINIALTIATKGKNPYTGQGDYQYLVPDCQYQRGSQYNYVVVCCEPHRNGVYRYPSENVSKYDKWENNGKPCYYVPIQDCEFREFGEIDWEEPCNKILKRGIIELQDRWFRGDITNKEPHKHRKKPDWFLVNLLNSEAELVGRCR